MGYGAGRGDYAAAAEGEWARALVWGLASRTIREASPIDAARHLQERSRRNRLPDDVDALEELGDEIAILSAHIHAATHQLLVMIAQFDRREGWTVEGHCDCAHWLSVRTGIDLGAARQKVRVAHALEKLPETSAAMARGELSFSKVRALARIATPEIEEELLEFARSNTAAQLEKLVRQWRDLNRGDEAERERRRHASRCFAVFPDEGGMYRVTGTLDPEVGAALMRAIEHASDALFRAEGAHPLEMETTPEQRRADAIGLLAERALALGFGVGSANENEDSGDDATRAATSTPAGASTCPATACIPTSISTPHPAPISGSRAERFQVVLTVDPATLTRGHAPGRSHLEDGTRVSAETARRLSCDCSLVPVKLDSDGAVLDVGRKTRSIPPAIRRALDLRDGGCRFPGCGLRFTDGHHLEHWVEGGETKLSNLVLLCNFHHRAVHEDGFRVSMLPGQDPKFFTPEGWPLGPSLPRVNVSKGDPAVELIQRNRRRGIRPNRMTCGADYAREIDIPDSLLFKTWEALDPG